MTENHYPDGSYDVDWAADDEPEYGEYELEELDESGFEPPTDDEREALRPIISEARRIQRPDYPNASTDDEVIDAVLAAGFRRQGPITDAMVEVAEAVAFQFPDSAEYVTFEDWRLARMRAALEAAERAR